MNNKIKVIIIVILILVLGLMCYLYFKDDNTSSDTYYSNGNITSKNTSNTTTTTKTTISASSQVKSALSENIELHATYYFKEIYVEENEFVKKGTKILKYTNGKYLKAPYDLVITSLNIPSSGDMVTNNHYISVSSNNNLCAQISVDETKISNISIGDSAKVKISALDKEVDGIVTNISNTASNGKFSVTVEFSNDSTIMIGMSVTVSI